jgi:hypothetical protein
MVAEYRNWTDFDKLMRLARCQPATREIMQELEKALRPSPKFRGNKSIITVRDVGIEPTPLGSRPRTPPLR